MKLPRISLCYYPTTIMLLDDNKKFLEGIEIELSKNNHLLIYDSTEKALKFLCNDYDPQSFIDLCTVTDDEDHSDHLVHDIDIRNIRKMMQLVSRFSEIATLVVDYAMPKMSGVEFSRKLRQTNPYIKIILLTGEAGHSLAVEAFNEGVIDKFIMKGKEDTVEILLQSIQDMQGKYFLQLSEMFISNAKRTKELSCLSDPAFVSLFENVIKDNNIVEYYLLDNQGSFVMLDQTSKPYWLLVKTEKEMNGLLEYAEFEKAPPAIVSALKSKEKFPYFHTVEDLQTPLAQWEPYMHPATKLDGKQTYFYAFIDDPKAFSFESNKVLSYEKYLESI